MVASGLQDLEENSGKVQAANATKLLGTIYRFGMALHPDKLNGSPVAAVKAIMGRDWAKRERRKTRVADSDLAAWYKAVCDYDNPKG
jgi:hypothetical protein